MKALLTSNEVIHFSGVSRDFPPCNFRLLYNVELTEFRRCLGLELYNELQADRVDYSAENDWSNALVYNTGNIVNHLGATYMSKENSNQTEPPSLKWELAPKFETQCYNDLWCLFLAEYLSWQVIRDKFAFVQYNLTGEGIQLIGGSRGNRSADKDEFKIYGSSVDRKIEDLYANIDYYMRNNCEEDFKNYTGNLEECVDGCEKGNRYRVG